MRWLNRVPGPLQDALGQWKGLRSMHPETLVGKQAHRTAVFEETKYFLFLNSMRLVVGHRFSC